MNKRSGPLTRALRNCGWLLCGKGVGGLLSLVYLGIAARVLGVTAFGTFVTILAFVQAIANLVSFQSWQTVVRYGAIHLANDRPDRLRRVLVFATALDFCAAIVGTAFAVGGALSIGTTFGWSIQEQQFAACFGLSLLVSLRGVPTGTLRLFDRFALAALTETALPAARLVGTIAAWAMAGGIAAFLAAWMAAELAVTLALWASAAHELRRNDLARKVGDPGARWATTENPGIIRFSLITNVSAAVGLFWQQLPLLMVAWFAGPANAGGYRLAAQVGTALAKPVGSFARSIYPEFARIDASRGPAALRPLLRRTVWIAAGLGVVSVMVALLAGAPLLRLIGGRDYDFAYPVLVLLAIASATNLLGFGLEPALVAVGHPGAALSARLIASAVHLMLSLWLVQEFGPKGAATAAVVATLCSVLLLWRGFNRAVPHCYRDGRSGA